MNNKNLNKGSVSNGTDLNKHSAAASFDSDSGQFDPKQFLKPGDGLILLFAVILTLWLYHIFWFDNKPSGEAEFLMIQITDAVPKIYSLSQDKTIKIEGAIGQSLIEIKQRKARFIHSPCYNQFCILHGWISNNGDITACLPNQISIRLQGSQSQSFPAPGKGSRFDAVSGGQ
ncbi:MAG: NusG domain II-containing protein [gamma proteobacterium symbiont of Taylorina sp.]|nr:NusG domain II-containing protein [gamma proteobacterium symbiont of Taylorina sp.]